ncbi:MAG: hypothetical protein JNN04_09845, partial [Cyclobacteriaceae bacterium]|nr:hypothetical protein [Cyclobacteriaceae bacterium]
MKGLTNRLTLMCFFLTAFVASGQRQFTAYSYEDFASVIGISQDSSGFLWISGKTVGRFDGYQVKKYYDSTGRAIRGPLSTDPSGKVWILERSGSVNLIHAYNRKKDSFETFRPNIGEASLVSLGFDKDGTIWLGTDGMGIFHFDPKTGESEQHVNPLEDSTNRALCNYIWYAEVLDDHLQLGTRFGLWRFDKRKAKYSRPSPIVLNTPLLSERPIRRIFRAKDHYWFYLPTQLVKADFQFNILGQFEFPPDLDVFSNTFNIEYDRQGTFWMATFGQGLVSYTPATDKVRREVKNPSIPHTLSYDLLRCVYVDRNQNIWIGTNGKGFVQLKKQSLVFHNLFLPENAPPGMAHVAETKNGHFLLHESKTEGIWISRLTHDPDEVHFAPVRSTLNAKGMYINGSTLGKSYWWLGTTDNGVIGVPLNKETGLPEVGPLKIFRNSPGNANTIEPGPTIPSLEDKRGTLWVYNQGINLFSTYGTAGSVTRHQSPSYFSSGRVAEAADGALWLLSDFHLQRFKDGKLETLYEKPTQFARHRSMKIMRDGSIYIGSLDGLTVGTPHEGKFVFKSVDAFRGRYVAAMEEDRKGNLWLSGGNGIFRYNRIDSTMVQFNVNDGLSDNEFYDMHSTQTSDGRFFFTSSQSLVMFDPLSYQPSSTKVQPVFTGLRVNNESVVVSRNRINEDDSYFVIPESISVLSELNLDYKHNIFTIEFSAMELTSPLKNQYMHKLDGFDEDWILSQASDRTATYTNLDAGTYVFRVKATNHDGVWSDKEAKLVVEVLPPPWRTWWAYAGYSLLGAGLLVLARRSIVQRERLKANLQLEHVELEKAKEVDRLKTSFFTNISHEFRTPLTLIKGPVDAMLDRFKDDPEAVKRLKLVQRNSELL